MNINVTDGRGIVTRTVQLYYDTGRQWVAVVIYAGDAVARRKEVNQDADGPTMQIAFDNLKSKLGW